jgi:hypothetical protein
MLLDAALTCIANYNATSLAPQPMFTKELSEDSKHNSNIPTKKIKYTSEEQLYLAALLNRHNKKVKRADPSNFKDLCMYTASKRSGAGLW